MAALLCVGTWGAIVLDLFEHKKVSLGEAIIIVLTIVPLATGFGLYLRKKFYALKMRISERAIPIGSANLTLQLRARVPLALERINFRFVERRWPIWTFKDAPIEKIRIDKVDELDWRTSDNKPYLAGSDTRGGIDVRYKDQKNWGEGEWLTARISISCHQPWSGYLSFEARSTERRLFVRRSFAVMEDRFVASL